MLLEEMLDEQEKQINRGKSVEQIHCAADMVAAAKLTDIEIELQRIREQLENIEANTRGND